MGITGGPGIIPMRFMKAAISAAMAIKAVSSGVALAEAHILYRLNRPLATNRQHNKKIKHAKDHYQSTK
jgi:hypothetical protein